MEKYIILEIIPTATKDGDIVQLSALKIHDLKLIDRFDYRLNENKIPYRDLIKMISYDKDKFIYKNSTKKIMSAFKKWCGNYDLLIIDNSYTLNYLESLNNKKESVFKYLNMEYNDNVIEDIIKKYKLEPSDYIVDLLYEALIYESNNKK
ncbi:MAG: hypothetical protein HFI86_01395 [Bacilli bacterium]|nr:hypothetical protein [Bacilli bacterium]